MDNFKKRKTLGTMFSNLLQKSNDGLLAFYSLSLIIARKSKPHTIGEDLILPSLKEVLETILHHKTSSAVIKSILLSYNMVQRRVDEMATNIEDRLCSIIRNTESNWMSQLCQKMRHYYRVSPIIRPTQ